MGDSADAAADRQADIDVGRRGSRGATDREAREDKDGEVADASGAGGAKGGSGECAGEAELVPGLVPVEDVTVFFEPRLDTWATYDKCIIKIGAMAEGVGAAL